MPLIPTNAEDGALLSLNRAGTITSERLPRTSGRRTSELTSAHLGAIRLYEQGLLRLASQTTTHQTWEWTNDDAEADGLRRLRHRSLGFIPYDLGYRGRTPETMTGAELAALLVWHFRGRPVRYLDVRHTLTGRIEVTAFSEHDRPAPRTPDETDSAPTVSAALFTASYEPVPALPDLQTHTRHIHCHRDVPHQRFDDVVVAALLTQIVSRTAVERFSAPGATIDLDSWRLRPYGYRASTVEEWLPSDLRDALLALDAPHFTDVEDLSDWASTNLQVTVVCRSDDENERRRGGHRHTLRLDPLTGGVTTVQPASVEAGERQDAHHLLAALAGSATMMRCTAVQSAWDSDGVVAATVGNANFTQVQRDRILAIHRVAQAIRRLHG